MTSGVLATTELLALTGAALLVLVHCSGGADPEDESRVQSYGCDVSMASAEAWPLIEAVDTLSFPLPDAAIDTSALTATERGLLAYALEVPIDDVLPELNAALASKRDAMGRVAWLALQSNGSDDGSGNLDLALLQVGFEIYYACQRGFPATLDEFESVWVKDAEARTEIVETSGVKLSERRLLDFEQAGIFVAQTAQGEAGDTEIILEGYRDDSALDFIAYDSDGFLTSSVNLPRVDPTAKLGAPSTCTYCHRDIDTNRIDVVDPRTR